MLSALNNRNRYNAANDPKYAEIGEKLEKELLKTVIVPQPNERYSLLE